MTLSASFPLEVEGVGAFTFRHRSIGDQFKIEAAAIKLLGGETASESLYRMAVAFATVHHLVITAPEGWDVEHIDPLDTERMDQVYLVFARLRAAEGEFRRGAKDQRTVMGAAA